MSGLGLICDLDGTLVDSAPGIEQSVRAVCEEFGHPRVPRERILENIGRGLENLIDTCLPSLVSEVGVAPLVEQYRQFYATLPLRGEVYPGVRETLKELHQLGWVLAIATNRNSEMAELVLNKFLSGIPFAYVGGADRVSARKPSPKHLTEVLEKLGLSATQSWYIGDHDVDAQSAAAAGIRFIGAGYGYGKLTEGTIAHFSEIKQRIL